jgi:hypothetical protein
VANRTIQIVIKAHNEASGAIEAAEKSVGKFGSGLGSMLAVAGGNMISSAISGMTSFFGSIASGALEAVGNAQTLEIAIEGLLTQSLMYQKVTETQQTYIELTAEERQELNELTASLNTQNAKLKEQEQRVWEMTNQWTDQGLATQTAKAKLEEMKLEITATEQEIAALTNKQGQLVTSTSASWQKTMEFGEAQELAKEQTQELLKYVQELSIISPFDTATVEQVVRIGLASGLSAEQVQDFTGAWLDFAATQGISSENLAFATDQLLQLKKAGKLTEIDLRQLRRMGIDLAKVIEIKMGMSVEEFNDQVAKNPALMDDMYNAFIEFSSETTAGASERMAGTIDGLMSSLHDIVDLGSRNLFRPIVEAISPFASDLIKELAAYVTGDDITNVGHNLANAFMTGFNFILDNIGTVNQLITEIQTALDGGWPAIEAKLLEWGGKFLGWLTNDTIPQVPTKISELVTAINDSLVSKWETTIKPALDEWTMKFWDWTNIVSENTPSNLTKITQGISDFLKNEWSVIYGSLQGWSFRFWDWADEAVQNIASGLSNLASGLASWAFSQEGQEALQELGKNIAAALIDLLETHFGSGDNINSIRATIAKTIISATATIAGSLLAAGASIVSGIIEGILEHIGMDVEIPTVNELTATLIKVADSVKNNVLVVGENIVGGIIEGIKNFQTNIGTALTDAIQAGIDIFKSFLGIASPSTVFKTFGISVIQGFIGGILAETKIGDTLISVIKTGIEAFKSFLGISSPSTVFNTFGTDIIQGLINGIKSMITNVSGAIGEVANNITSFLTEQWNTNIYPTLSTWGNSFFNWTTEIVIPAITEKVGAVTSAIVSYLREQWDAFI